VDTNAERSIETNQSLLQFKDLNKTFLTYFFSEVRSKFQIDYISTSLKDLVNWRNYIISPFTEEFVFRSCMIPLVCPFLGTFNSMMVTPLFFGLAHLHNIIEGYVVSKLPLDVLIGQHLFQFSYTYLFGIYATYLFIRTGSFFGPFASHILCNYMGFPNINDLVNEFNGWQKAIIILFYAIGFFSFSCLIIYATVPDFFNNTVFMTF
jgi:prenyl protein peptidase